MAEGRAIVDARYPEYRHSVAAFGASASLAAARMAGYRATNALLAGQRPLPRILFVIATQTGGTPQTNADLMRAFDGDVEGWTLRCDSKELELCRLQADRVEVIARHMLAEPVDPLTHHSHEYAQVVQGWLLAHDFDLIHIRHLAWHSLQLPSIAKRLHIRSVFSFHDFYMLSPTIKMIDDAGTFLGDHFTPEGRDHRESLWPRGVQPDPTGPWLHFWRQRNLEALLQCDAFVTTSDSARALILRHMPELPAARFKVIPHGRDFANFTSLRAPYLRYDAPLRILLPGNINEAKGLNVIFDLLQHDRAGRLEFHVLGNIDLRRHSPHPRLVLHGTYKREEFAERVAQLNIHAGAIFSIWDETYCHTLTELWSVGLPAVVFDMPNVAGRMRKTGAGWVLDHRNIPDLYEKLLSHLTNPKEQTEKAIAVADWQSGYGAAYGTRAMASHYIDIYRDILRPEREATPQKTARVAVVCASDAHMRLAAASPASRLWERCRNSLSRDVTYIRITPEALAPAAREGLIDAAILHCTALPRPLVAPSLAALRAAQIPFLMDVDDDLTPTAAEDDPHGMKADYAPAFHALLAEAACVTAPSATLLQKLAPYTQHVTLLPDQLAPRLWPLHPSTTRRADKEVRALYLPDRASHLDLILPALDAVHARAKRLRLTVITTAGQAFSPEGREDWLEVIATPPEAQAHADLLPWLLTQAHRFDFALAPSPQSEAVAGHHLLTYAVMGLPILASATNSAQNEKDPGPILRVQNSEQAWDAALSAALKRAPRTENDDEACRAWASASLLTGADLVEFDQLVSSLLHKA